MPLSNNYEPLQENWHPSDIPLGGIILRKAPLLVHRGLHFEFHGPPRAMGRLEPSALLLGYSRIAPLSMALQVHAGCSLAACANHLAAGAGCGWATGRPRDQAVWESSRQLLLNLRMRKWKPAVISEGVRKNERQDCQAHCNAFMHWRIYLKHEFARERVGFGSLVNQTLTRSPAQPDHSGQTHPS